MGESTNPEGNTIGINSRYLTKEGKPWMPVMGEFHFSRTPQHEWREELLRMKAGGIDIAATYVFWIHHEEVESEWDWSGQRNLREFVLACKEVGILASIRIGPWCHGEVRNGGIPDWAVDKSWRLRSNDPAYLKQVRKLYEQIANQLDGLLWKDGGPVIAIQLENEYRGPAEHLLELKKIARQVGLDVPLYTRTGWPELSSKIPFGEIAPLYGAYAEGFWDRTLRSMPGKYWAAFRFMHVRTDAAIATEQLGERAIRDEADALQYPFLTCELGGGMMSSYHRRLDMAPCDIQAVMLTKLGSGGNLPGYYMYHGGVNPVGRLTTLMESQATRMTNYNDMPVKNYDFQAPIGSYGQTRPHYHWLRRVHLFLRDFGHLLAPMPAFLPERLPQGKEDTSTLRWAVRSNGESGFLFVNNHQRGTLLNRHEQVQFKVVLPEGDILMPATPVTINPGDCFAWPFNLALDSEVKLEYATAQLVCKIEEDYKRTYFFAEIPGIPAAFKLNETPAKILTSSREAALTTAGNTKAISIVLLSQQDSLALWKGSFAGQDRVLLTEANALFDQGAINLQSETRQQLSFVAYPQLQKVKPAEEAAQQKKNPTVGQPVRVNKIREAGTPRVVTLGHKGVAIQPSDDDFRSAAAWEIELPETINLTKTKALLRITYHGDVARLKIGGKLVFDDFYNGKMLEVGLNRYAEQLAESQVIEVEILPFPSDAPITYPSGAKRDSLVSLDKVEIVPILQRTVSE